MSDAGAINTAGGQPGAAKGQAQIPAPPKLVKVFVDGGWVLVLPDPDMPRYHIIVSMEDSDKARALADQYSALVKTAGTPPA